MEDWKFLQSTVQIIQSFQFHCSKKYLRNRDDREWHQSSQIVTLSFNNWKVKDSRNDSD